MSRTRPETSATEILRRRRHPGILEGYEETINGIMAADPALDDVPVNLTLNTGTMGRTEGVRIFDDTIEVDNEVLERLLTENATRRPEEEVCSRNDIEDALLHLTGQDHPYHSTIVKDKMKPLIFQVQQTITLPENYKTKIERLNYEESVARHMKERILAHFRDYMEENIKFDERADESGLIIKRAVLEITAREKGAGLLDQFLETEGMEDNYVSAINVGADRFKCEITTELYEQLKNAKE